MGLCFWWCWIFGVSVKLLSRPSYGTMLLVVLYLNSDKKNAIFTLTPNIH
jgi:hypothetical protein